jgi:Ca-activated chloride channel homolog
MHRFDAGQVFEMKFRLLAVTLILCSLAPSLCAQTPAGSESDISESVTTIRASVQEVNVFFTATDKRGKFRKDLQASDLAVLDDGKPPAAVRSFRSETDLPLRVGLVIDSSGSVTDRFAFEQESAIHFVNEILRPKVDQAFVVTFASTPKLQQDFTDDIGLLARAARSTNAGGGSAVYDAVALAANRKLANLWGERPVRRVIILLSDGEDNQSSTTRPQVIEAARRSGVTVYTISTNISNVITRGDKVLQRLADETGGRAFYPNKISDVVNAFRTIEEELRSQYAVAYKPAEFIADGRYRSINIQARNKDVFIRARKGYFAPKD